MPTIAPCLWFDTQAEDAAHFYCGIFPNSKVTQVSRYGKEGFEIHGRSEGSVMTVEFELAGQRYTALNGGPIFKFSEAISLEVRCSDQDEVDYFWNKLGAGGDPNAQQCGWLKDKFGLSWQIVPQALVAMMTDRDRIKAQRAFGAMMKMKKLDVALLLRAFNGTP